MDSDRASDAPGKKRRGPYRRYTVDLESEMPKSTKFRRRNETPGLSLTGLHDDETVTAGDSATASVSVTFGDGDGVQEECLDTFSVDSESEFPLHDDSYDSKETDDESNHLHSDVEELPLIRETECQAQPNEGERDLYDGARLTLESSTLLIETFAIRHSLSSQALIDLLHIIELHCPLPNLCRVSLNQFHRLFNTKNNDIRKHYYCDYCGLSTPGEQHQVQQHQQIVCSSCEKRIPEETHFLTVPVETQLKSLLPDGLQQILDYKQSMQRDGIVSDVTDGQLYRDVFNNGQHFAEMPNQESEIHISLQVNTDGVAVFKSSSQSAWPVYFTINELPPALRFTRKYKMLAGLWFGSKKPDMNIYMQPFVEELLKLFDEGLEITYTAKKMVIKVALLSGVFDAPARCAMQNMLQFNGYYGCGTCYAHGASVVNLKGTKSHVYPYDTSEDNVRRGHADVRTHAQTKDHAKQAESTNQTHLGVKGHAFLASLPKFDIIRGIAIDYMHAVLLGVMKMLLDLWTNKDYKNLHWYIGDKMQDMNKRISALSPPNRITRLPRKLEDLSNWKASELRSFLLYYSVPVLVRILPEEHLDHFLLFSRGVYLLLQGEIQHSEIMEAERVLRKFCMMIDVLYDACFEKSNVHALLHLTGKVRDLGPLWAHSCFFYEDLNGDLRSLFHGTVNAAGQILNAICIQQELPKISNRLLPGSPAHSLYEQMTTYRKLKASLEYIQDGIHAVEPIVQCEPNQDLKLLLARCHMEFGRPSHMFKFERLLLHHQVFHSQAYKAATRRNSYTVMFADHLYGFVMYYLKLDTNDGTQYVAVIQQLKMLTPNSVPAKLPAHIHVTTCDTHEDDIVIVHVNQIKELCIFLQGDKEAYVAMFPNRVERE